MTAAEKIALVSVVSSGAVGLAAVLGAGLGGWRDRVHARNMARTARQQERLEWTYVELLAYIHRRRVALLPVQPKSAPPQADPLRPDPDPDMDRIRALVGAHASPSVRALLDEFNDAAGQVVSARLLISMIRWQVGADSPGGTLHPDDHDKFVQVNDELNEQSTRLQALEEQIHQRVREELASS